jgi:hypothetical protein
MINICYLSFRHDISESIGVFGESEEAVRLAFQRDEGLRGLDFRSNYTRTMENGSGVIRGFWDL